jgi:hypothetical protein
MRPHINRCFTSDHYVKYRFLRLNDAGRYIEAHASLFWLTVQAFEPTFQTHPVLVALNADCVASGSRVMIKVSILF